MAELVSIREFSRRIGVSDTAVHKAIRNHRIVLAQESPPKLDWSTQEARWHQNSDSSKRSHVGPQGSPRREGEAPRVQLPLSSTGAGPGSGAGAGGPSEEGEGSAPRGGVSYAQSRAIRETFAARLAKLEYEERTGRLVDADAVKVAWFKQIKAAQTKILGIPAACKSRAADLPLTVITLIDQICRESLEDLANNKNAND